MWRDAIYRLLQEGIKKKDIVAARRAQLLMTCTALDSVPILGDHLIRLLADCGQLQEAHNVFGKVLCPSVYTWNAMIYAQVELGEPGKALELYYQMQQHGTLPNKIVFLSMLKVCSSVGDLKHGRLVCKEIRMHGFVSDIAIGNNVIDMFLKCESIEDARTMFNELPNHDLVSWSIMIAGYAKVGWAMGALELYQQMKSENLLPNHAIFLSILKMCINLGDAGTGMLFHSEIMEAGLENEVVIMNILVDIYARFASIFDASDTFNKMAKRDIVSWTVMIAGSTQHGNFPWALDYFYRLQHEGFYPSNVTFSCILKACSSAAYANQGTMIHTQVLWRNLKDDTVIGNTLLDLYAKCGIIKEAEHVFNVLQDHDVVSWCVMISMYVEQGQNLVAFKLFRGMMKGLIEPNKAVFLCMLKACASLASISTGRCIHNMIVEGHVGMDVAIGSSLSDMYLKCCSLSDALSVFVNMSERDGAAWNTIILGHIQHGQWLIASQLLQEMQIESVNPDLMLFLSMLRTFNQQSEIDDVKSIHNQVIYFGFDLYTVVGNALIELYGRLGEIAEAHAIFERLHSPDNVSWNSIIAISVQHDTFTTAFEKLERMQQQGLKPDRVVLLYVLQACRSMDGLDWGRLMHCQIIGEGFESDVAIGSTLIDMYAKCGSTVNAIDIFRHLDNKNTVSWGAMIAGYTQDGLFYRSLELYDAMAQVGIQPSDAALVCSLKACASIGNASLGRIIHHQMILDRPQSNIVVEGMLVDMYARCRNLEDSFFVFEQLPTKTAVAWTAVLSGCVHDGLCDHALELFEQMMWDGFRPTKTAILYSLKACADLGTLVHARMIQDLVVASGMELDVIIGNAVLDVYVQCGEMDEAYLIFNSMSGHDVVSFSLLIGGFSRCNNSVLALQCVDGLHQEGVMPDSLILTHILTACSHDGLWKEACFHFNNFMVEKCQVNVDIEHYNCFANVLGRSGYLSEAESLLRNMPFLADVVGWRALLTCSQRHGDVNGGVRCYDEIKLFPLEHPSAEALLCDLRQNVGTHPSCQPLGAGKEMFIGPENTRSDSDITVHEYTSKGKTNVEQNGNHAYFNFNVFNFQSVLV